MERGTGHGREAQPGILSSKRYCTPFAVYLPRSRGFGSAIQRPESNNIVVTASRQGAPIVQPAIHFLADARWTMKITMFGATGPTGKHFTALALKNGHEVTALVRDASKLSAADKLSIVVGDATDEKAVKRVVDGAGKLMRIRTGGL